MLALSIPIQAQDGAEIDELRPRYGLLGGINLNIHAASFSGLPGIPSCCPEYRSGFGLGPSFAFFFEQPLSQHLLLDMRAGYSSASATLLQTERTVVESNGKSRPIDIEHSIEAGLGSIGIEPLLDYRLNNQLSLSGGFRLGYVLEKNYTQQEKISDDTPHGTFENGLRTRHEFDGEIPNASSIEVSLLGGVSYELPLNTTRTFLAAPEVLFSYGLTPIAENISWNPHGLRAGIAIKYSPKPKLTAPPLPPTAPRTPPTPRAPHILAASVHAFGLNNEGIEESIVTLNVEEFVASKLHPVLNYIFFENNSSNLPERFVQLPAESTWEFEVDQLNGNDPLYLYRHTLNILGKRMVESSGTTIQLTGTNAGKEVEAEGRVLSQERARAVKSYLQDTWGINPERIHTNAQDLPEKPSNITELDGIAENRRVEIRTQSDILLAPLALHDTIRKAAPPTIRFKPSVESTQDIASWNIIIQQNGEQLKSIDGKGNLPGIVDWKIDRDKESIPQAPGKIFYTLQITDTEGKTFETTPESIELKRVTIQKKRRERMADVEIDRYSLILFEYDVATLNSDHRAILSSIAKNISPESHVIIRGFADRTGNRERNRELALERARAVEKALNLSTDKLDVSGSEIPLYDNSLPEGRFYSRTVTIEVRTPISDGESG